MMSERGAAVELHIYDLTLGFASMLAPAIIGQQVEGVWHTAVVVFGREYFYGGQGITSCAPGGTALGRAQKVEQLGETFVPRQVFLEYLRGLADTSYTAAAYDLLRHNCNHFSEEVAGFLCGASIPKHILRQPEELLSGPQGAALRALLDTLAPPQAQTVYGNTRAARQDSPEYDALNSQIEEARVASRSLCEQRSSLADKLARKERRREKKKKKLLQHGENSHPEMSDAVEVAAAPASPVPGGAGLDAVPDGAADDAVLSGTSSGALDELDERRRAELARRAKNPPIVFKDIDGLAELEALRRALEGSPLAAEAQQSLDELQQFLQGEGSWVLGDDFLAFIGRVLSSEEAKAAARAAVLRCLAAGALREDISLVLHQDRRHHALLNYAHRIDCHPLEEQRPLAMLMCNLFENISSAEWLLYISEWEVDGRPLSNIRVTTKVTVHALLSEDPELRELGTALVYNVATKERFQAGKPLRDLLPRQARAKVFDEVCVELCMAVLQLLGGAPAEPHLFRALAALARLAHHAADVPQFIAMVGPDPSAFRGTSARCDEQIDAIMKKMK